MSDSDIHAYCEWCGTEGADELRPRVGGGKQWLCDDCADEYDEANGDDEEEGAESQP